MKGFLRPDDKEAAGAVNNAEICRELNRFLSKGCSISASGDRQLRASPRFQHPEAIRVSAIACAPRPSFAAVHGAGYAAISLGSVSVR